MRFGCWDYIVPIQSRFEWMDFLHGHMDGSAAMIIKRPELVNENIHAIAKPFQPWVFHVWNFTNAFKFILN